MGQRFKPGKPSDQEILDYAAGLGLEFVPGSIEETYFLNVGSWIRRWNRRVHEEL